LSRNEKRKTKNKKTLENESTWNETKTTRITNNVSFFFGGKWKLISEVGKYHVEHIYLL
jgi:hypothetical protein